MSYLTTSLNPQNSDPTPRHRGRRVRRPRPILVGGRHRADDGVPAVPSSYARDVLGHCDEPSPGTEPGATMGNWCSKPVGHDGQHAYYGLDLWTEEGR